MKQSECEIAWASGRQAELERLLVGRTIKSVSVECKYERIDNVTVRLDDGTAVEFDYWASYADDASLEFAPKEPS